MKLSGGQKQRLAIARSIIKKPQVMILDEATSAIDAKNEKLVQAALEGVTRDRTTITIAHRLSTIKKADHIIVLQSGRAVEEGTHQSLITDPAGVYSALVRAQALRLSGDDEVDPDTSAPASDAESEKLPDSCDDAATPTYTGAGQDMVGEQPRSLIQCFSMLLYEQRAQWPWFLSIILSCMATAAATPIQAWLFAKVIGTFLLDIDKLGKEVNFWGLMWLALAAGVGVAYLFQGWTSLHVQYFVSAAYKMRYLTGMLHQRVPFFDGDGNAHGTLSSRIASDAKLLEELFGLNLAFLLSGVGTAVGCTIITLIFGWKLGLVGMFVTMPVMMASGIWKFRQEVQFDEMNSAVFRESSQFATEAIGAFRTVASLTMEDAISSQYRKLLDDHVKAARRKAQWTAVFFGFADSASLGCQALIFWYGGKLLFTGEYTLEAFFVCFMAIIQGTEIASQVLAVAPDAAQATAAANRIFDIQKSAGADRDSEKSTKPSGDLPGAEFGVQIELRDVHFKYPTRDVVVFQGLNLSIEKGQYVAFVGPSGCGKTTIISLLERFYDLDANHGGTILCNGVNINDMDVYNYRQNLSLVAQEPTMFRGTVRDNILFGVADPGSVSDERIHDVCRDAFIHDFIVSLPQGYDTDVGQGGVSMSGGQKQRIAIARALIRNPRILLLDEATSALDSESEKIAQAALERARHGRTMIAVAHRLSTIQNADVIFVFDEGTVVEKGTHSELLKKRGPYWDMVSVHPVPLFLRFSS